MQRSANEPSRTAQAKSSEDLESELLFIGFLRTSPAWSSWKFVSGRMATPGSSSLNLTFVGA